MSCKKKKKTLTHCSVVTLTGCTQFKSPTSSQSIIFLAKGLFGTYRKGTETNTDRKRVPGGEKTGRTSQRQTLRCGLRGMTS